MQKNFIQYKYRKQKGLSLIEAAMVLALAAIVVSGVFMYWNSTRTNQVYENTSQAIMHISQQMQALYANKPPHLYGGIGDPEGRRLLKLFNPSWHDEANFYDRLGRAEGTIVTSSNLPGGFEIRGSASGDARYKATGPYYIIQFWFKKMSDSEAYDLCMHIVSTDYGNGVFSKQINHQGNRDDGSDGSYVSGTSSVAEISAACSYPGTTGVTLFMK